MSVWKRAKDELPPLNEDVLVLYKDKADKLSENDLYYSICHRFIFDPFNTGHGAEVWSYFTEYQGYYEIVYWTPLLDVPSKLVKEDTHD